MKHIFVSSTFRDMQAERDMLHLDVIPELNERAQKYGDSVGLIDLRWGVNTGELDSESGAKKVLEVCLDEIDRSNPYMLVFLGERYGWIPDGKLMADCSAQKQYTLDDMEKSVTALEIEYGALSGKGNLERCIFCIRAPLPYEKMPQQVRADYLPESPAHQKKLEALKKRIRNLLGDRVIDYRADWDTAAGKVTGLAPLGQQLCDRLAELFQKEWLHTKDSSWQQQEQLGFSEFMAHKRSQFTGRKELVAQLQTAALKEENDVLVLRGTPGMGKSSLMSVLADSLAAAGCTVIPFVCGNSALSSTLGNMLRILTYSLAEAAQLTQSEDKLKDMPIDELVEAFTAMLAYAGGQTDHLVLVIDAIDQLEPHRLIEICGWLPKTRALLKGATIIFSCGDAFPLSFPRADREEATLQVAELALPFADRAEREAMIAGILRASSKGVDRPVIDTLLAKKSTENPLYLSLLLHRLILMNSTDFADADRLGGGAQGINLKMMQLIKECPDDLEQMSVSLLTVAAKHFDLPSFAEAMSYLAVSRYGLGFDALTALMQQRGLPWSTLDFTRLLKFMRPYFLVRPDGRVDFTHQSIRRGFLPKGQLDQDAAHHLISDYIKTLPQSDPLRANEAFYHARLSHDFMFCVAQMVLEGKTCGDVTWAANLQDQANTTNGSKPLFSPDATMFAQMQDALQAGKIKRVQRNSIAQEVYAVCMADGGQWLTDVLKETENEPLSAEDKVYLGRFLLWSFWNIFVYTAPELRVLTPVFQQVQVLMDLFAEEKGPEAVRNKAFAHVRMARVCEETDRYVVAVNNYIDAFHIYDNSLESGIWNQIFPGNLLRDYAFLHAEAVFPLNWLGRYDEALFCAKEAYKFADRVAKQDHSQKAKEEFANAKFAMGLAHLQLDHLEEAYKFFASSILEVNAPLPKEALPDEDDPMPGDGLIQWADKKDSFDKDWFRVFNELSDNDAFYEEPDESDLLSRLTSDGEPIKRSTEALRRLSLAYDKAGLVQDMGGATKLARNHYLYAVVFAQEADKSGRVDTRGRLAYSYTHLSNAYLQMERYGDAFETSLRALRLYDELSERVQTVKSKSDYIYQVLSTGFVFDLQDEDAESFKWFTAAAELAEILLQENAAVDVKELTATCLRCAGNVSPDPKARRVTLSRAKALFEELYEETQKEEYQNSIEDVVELLG